jgi:hypothetical protein
MKDEEFNKELEIILEKLEKIDHEVKRSLAAGKLKCKD